VMVPFAVLARRVLVSMGYVVDVEHYSMNIAPLRKKQQHSSAGLIVL
jgi:hypothetical protein